MTIPEDLKDEWRSWANSLTPEQRQGMLEALNKLEVELKNEQANVS